MKCKLKITITLTTEVDTDWYPNVPTGGIPATYRAEIQENPDLAFNLLEKEWDVTVEPVE